MKETAIERAKMLAAESAVKQLESGMIVGLGSGTTAALAVAAIGTRVEQGLRIIGIPTSEQTGAQAHALGIPLSTLNEHPSIDMTIDGADEVEIGTLDLIKGGGGNLLREKIVACASSRLVIIVDDSKPVRRLGSRFPVPVEIIPFGWESTAKRLDRLDAHPTLRMRSDGGIFLTDGGHYILDCAFGPIASPPELESRLDGIVGVVEHGLFIGLTSQVLVGGSDGVKVLDRE